MQDFYHQAGPCGAAIILLGLFAVYAAVRGLVLTILTKKQAKLEGSAINRILKQVYGTEKAERSFTINILLQSELQGIYSAMYFLKLCAAIGPLLGLLGTVLGMVDVFSTLSEKSYPEPSMLAGGIWQALITTVMGLSLAIPALLVHYILLLNLRYFRNYLNLKAVQLQEQDKDRSSRS